MAYTYIPKPTGYGYTNVNSQGREQYDQSNLTYDDASTFYDGVDYNAYINIPKPTGYLTLVGGMTMGLLIPLTNPGGQIVGDPYFKVNKPTT